MVNEEKMSKYKPVELGSDTDVRQLQKRAWDERGKPTDSPVMGRKTIR